MNKKSKSFLGVAALAAGFSLGPGLSTAQAAWRVRSPRAAFSGRFGAPFGRARFASRGRLRGGPFFAGRAVFPRPFLAAPFRPFRLVRVFVYDPFPHWAYRRVYADPYCYGY